ncbi:dehydrogenase [Bosea sp. Tri-44]|uniref:YciI family protein n=1 Tax=Bosea sp. Tri-44 TaxID=1972137 RepID=UPI00100F5197|nr:YciI family protein [Bosea sp. Tri-44]RXT50478.1 dehydrogenase [Bosea sp. Tri-44]
MRFIVLVKATKDSEAGAAPTRELVDAMMAYNEELVKAGIMKGGDGLQPSAKGARVQFDGDRRSVVDGPFAETKELVAGYWIWECKSLDEAIAWVKRCPNPMPGPSEIEIRPVVDLADFGDAVSPEADAAWKRLKSEVGDNG